MGVVIVVPAFAAGQQGNPPVVAGVIAGFEAARTPQVRGGIDQPGGVQSQRDAQEDAPQNPGPAAMASRISAQRESREPSGIC